MKIRCLRIRPAGTAVTLGASRYHFKPNEAGHHVADVIDGGHIKTLLKIAAYEPYLEETPTPEGVIAGVVPVDPAAALDAAALAMAEAAAADAKVAAELEAQTKAAAEAAKVAAIEAAKTETLAEQAKAAAEAAKAAEVAAIEAAAATEKDGDDYEVEDDPTIVAEVAAMTDEEAIARFTEIKGRAPNAKAKIATIRAFIIGHLSEQAET